MSRLVFIAAIFFLFTLAIFKVVSEAKWDGVRRFTVAVDGDPLLLFSIEPLIKQAILLIIPPQTILEVPYGYDTYPASAVYKLGNLDASRGGGKLLAKSLENTFEVVVEGYIAAKGDHKFIFPTQKDKLLDIKKNYFSLVRILFAVVKFQAISGNVISSLTLPDWLRIWLAVRNLRNDKISIIDLTQSGVLSEEKLPDGTAVWKVDKELFDQAYGLKFQDQQVRAQNVTVEVVNATEREKLATGFSRILKNLGVNVVSISTSPAKENFNCKVLVFEDSLVSSIIIKRLEKFYKCKIARSSETAISDFKVILGEEFVR